MTIGYKTTINYPNGKPNLPADQLGRFWYAIDHLNSKCLTGIVPLLTDLSPEQGGFTTARIWQTPEAAQEYVDLVNASLSGLERTITITEEEV